MIFELIFSILTLFDVKKREYLAVAVFRYTATDRNRSQQIKESY